MVSSHSLRKLFLLIIFSFLIPITSFAAKGVPVAKGTDLHHIFPKEVECFNYFTSIGINPHLFTIPLSRDEHMLLHSHNFLAGAGARYNDAWKRVFIPNVPSSDPRAKEKAFLYAGVLLSEFGIGNKCFDVLKKEFHNYVNRKGGGDTVFDEIWKSAKNYAEKFLKQHGAKIIYVYISYEVIRIAIAADDRFPDFKYVDASKKYFEKSLLVRETDFGSSCDLLAEAYLNLGLAYFTKYLDSEMSFPGKVVNLITSNDEERLNVSSICFKNAVELSPDNPYNQIFYAESCYFSKDYTTSKKHARKALDLFKELGNSKMITRVEKLINKMEEN